MFLITASSCLACLHHSQLIKHFLLLSTDPVQAAFLPHTPGPNSILTMPRLPGPPSLSCHRLGMGWAGGFPLLHFQTQTSHLDKGKHIQSLEGADGAQGTMALAETNRPPLLHPRWLLGLQH